MSNHGFKDTYSSPAVALVADRIKQIYNLAERWEKDAGSSEHPEDKAMRNAASELRSVLRGGEA